MNCLSIANFQVTSTPLFTDNEVALALTKKPSFLHTLKAHRCQISLHKRQRRSRPHHHHSTRQDKRQRRRYPHQSDGSRKARGHDQETEHGLRTPGYCWQNRQIQEKSSPLGVVLDLGSNERYETWYKSLPEFNGESSSLGEAEVVPKGHCY